MSLTRTNQPLRRRTTRTSGRIELFRNYCLVLWIFGFLVIWFTPPNDNEYNNNTTSVVTTTSAVDSSPPKDPIAIVACEISTPHSQHPKTAAGGKLEIAILDKDIARKGSSAENFLRLVDEKFYDGCYTFRVIPGFIVQWGHRGDDQKSNVQRNPESDTKLTRTTTTRTTTNSKEQQASATMRFLQQKENLEGTITMIGGTTGQVFINTGDNRRLDKDGTIPFGVILETSGGGMELVRNIYHDYEGGQGQIPAINNHQVASKFPEMGRIDRCYRK